MAAPTMECKLGTQLASLCMHIPSSMLPSRLRFRGVPDSGDGGLLEASGMGNSSPQVGSTVSTIRGMFSTRPSTRADDLHAISTRHGIDRRRSQSARALNTWLTTASVQGEYRSSAMCRARVGAARQPGRSDGAKVAPES